MRKRFFLKILSQQAVQSFWNSCFDLFLVNRCFIFLPSVSSKENLRSMKQKISFFSTLSGKKVGKRVENPFPLFQKKNYKKGNFRILKCVDFKAAISKKKCGTDTFRNDFPKGAQKVDNAFQCQNMSEHNEFMYVFLQIKHVERVASCHIRYL